MRLAITLFCCALAAYAQSGRTSYPQKFFGTAAPGSVTGNLPGDTFTDTTNGKYYICEATISTAPPACTSVATNGWVEIDPGVAQANIVTAASNFVSGNLVSAAGANKTTQDAGIAAANVVAAASAATAAKQLCTASGTSKSCTYIDFPDTKIIPVANCVAGTAGAAVDLPTTNAPTAICLSATATAHTNNLGGALSWANNNSTTNAQFSFELPADWDTATQPWVSIY